MLILGLHFSINLETEIDREGFGLHDSAAVLLKDGEVVAAIEEERLSRVKHANFFPKRAIQFCLDQVHATLADIDYIAINQSELDFDQQGIDEAIENSSTPVRDGREVVSRYFEELYGQNVSNKLIFCPHHIAHAWSTFAVSGFKKSLVFVFDGDGYSGDGDILSGLVGLANGNEFKVLYELPEELSLGNFYTDMIRLIGYDRFDEYKVMGLAPYGDPERFKGLFNRMYRLKMNGRYSIVDEPAETMWELIKGIEGLYPPRRKGEAFTQIHKDFAAALQQTLEKIVLHIVKHFQKKTKLDALTLAGGVAHNCTLNGELLRSQLFKKIYVQPAAHDAGTAVGAALFAHAKKSSSLLKEALPHLYLGTNLPEPSSTEKILKSWQPSIRFSKSENVCRATAELLANDAVIGWVQGRSEFGPRALGNRSILADPRPEYNKERINKMIKKREGYRPFAPSVLEEKAADFFDIGLDSKSWEFMNLITTVKESEREKLGAITHVDGTARIQSVSKKTNPRYWQLISEFEHLSNTPILLNTSFNNNAEPVVDSIDDAIQCFLTTELTHLVIDDFIIERDVAITESVSDLHLRVKPSCMVAAKHELQSGEFVKTYTIESNVSRYFSKVNTTISEQLFKILSLTKGMSLKDACESQGFELNTSLSEEIINLSSERFILWSGAEFAL